MLRSGLAIAMDQYEPVSGVRVLAKQDFGAQPGDRNSLGYKDDIDQPPVEGCRWRSGAPLILARDVNNAELGANSNRNLHRLIRRGATSGPPYDPGALSEEDDHVPRGASFMFISAKALATIDFLQQEWVNDGVSCPSTGSVTRSSVCRKKCRLSPFRGRR